MNWMNFLFQARAHCIIKNDGIALNESQEFVFKTALFDSDSRFELEKRWQSREEINLNAGGCDKFL